MRIKSLIAAVTFVAVTALPASAAVVFFDSFNNEIPAGGLNYSTFDNWTVTQGSVDLIPVGAQFDYYPGNGGFVDLNGSTNVLGQLTTTQSFAAGSYTLTFSLGGSFVNGQVPKTTRVTLGSFTQDITLDWNAGLSSQSFTFGTTGGNLIFTSLAGGNANIGNVLDNVSLASAVPEPATWALMIIGFAAVGFTSYGRSRKRASLAETTELNRHHT